MELKKTKFEKLKLDEIRPQGWIWRQLQIQANGISGNLDNFWPDIKDSAWIGGTKDGWERVPYWLDGFIPLAFLLNREDMKERAAFYIDEILKRQQPDGWICPGERSNYDMWAYILVLKVLTVWHDATEDARIEDVIYSALKAFDKHIDSSTLFGWGQARWFEALIPIYWIYKRRPEEWIITFANKLSCQGFDWISFLNGPWPYENIDDTNKHWGFWNHGVNNAMMLKQGALLWRLSGDDELLKATRSAQNLLDKFHGSITGVFTSDECLAGKSPVQGTELCTVVEYMYSLEHLIETTGDILWADKLERVAFNALPATFSPDMHTHQYDQQVNQVRCAVTENPVFKTNGAESNLFGVEPNYGCCTANLSQGWPKFVLSAYMKADDGIAVISYLPCEIKTKIKGIMVNIKTETMYPFKDDVKITVSTESTFDFSIYLRVPAFADYAEINIEGSKIIAKKGEFYNLNGSWSGETVININIVSSFVLQKRQSNLYALTRGALVYALPIEEKWEEIPKDTGYHNYPYCDYAVYPESSWNYGFFIDKNDMRLEIKENNEPAIFIFSPQTPPTEVYIPVKKVGWELEKGSAAPTPSLEIVSETEEKIKLIPYGCTNLRMTEMPLLK